MKVKYFMKRKLGGLRPLCVFDTPPPPQARALRSSPPLPMSKLRIYIIDTTALLRRSFAFQILSKNVTFY